MGYDAQERKMEKLREKTELIPSCIETLSQIKTGIEGLRKDVEQISFPEKEIEELSERLGQSKESLKQPVEQKIVQHHHHVPKVMWTCVVLFLLLCLVLTGWYNTYNKVDSYKANDTKYRYLKLEANGDLSRRFNFLDSLYYRRSKNK